MSSDYLSMSNPAYDKILTRVRETFPNSCVCWIEQVKNDELLKRYQSQKSAIPNELQLFHGTSQKNIDAIIKNGFNPAYNVRSLYGNGTYFAQDAIYSFDYMPVDSADLSYMLLCDVLVGTPGIDCTTNNDKKPTIFAIPGRYSAFPKYIIAFHKYAK